MTPRHCPKCNEEQVRYREYTCKNCREIYLREWQRKNRIDQNKKKLKWAEDNRLKSREIKKRHENKDREAHLEYRKKLYAEGKRKTDYKDDPQVKRAAKNRRRAKRIGNGFVKYNPQDIFNRDNNTCVYCGETGTHLDHLVPISRGGPDTPENVAVACQHCNCSKGTKTATEFMLPQFKKVVNQMEQFS